MKKKIILVLFLAIQVPCIFSAPVQDEQVTLLAKQKREFVRGVRGIRHIFSKDTITPEERAALKSLVKKGAVLTAALAGIAVAGYVGKKLGKKYLGKKDSSSEYEKTDKKFDLCGTSIRILLPTNIDDVWSESRSAGRCTESVTIKRTAPSPQNKFDVTVRVTDLGFASGFTNTSGLNEIVNVIVPHFKEIYTKRQESVKIDIKGYVGDSLSMGGEW